MKQEYIDKIKSEIKLEILGKIKTSNDRHKIRCMLCNNIFKATPKSKLSNYNKHGMIGCPKCTRQQRYLHVNDRNIGKLENMGYELQEEYKGLKEKIKIRNLNCDCGRVWETTPERIFTGRSFCRPCNDDRKRKRFDAYNKNKAIEAYNSKDGFEQYAFDVRRLTEQTYRKHKIYINPNGYTRGRAGKANSYHLDHKLSIQYCYTNNVPSVICSHVENLQMLHWKQNNKKYQKQTEIIPRIFSEYLHNHDIKLNRAETILNKVKTYEHNIKIGDIVFDLFSEELNIGILFHRNIDIQERLVGKMHLKKILNQCTSSGTRVIQFFEDEWCNNFDVVMSKILHISEVNASTAIYARKCTIREITAVEKRNILKHSHIQGNDSSTLNLGAFYEKVLVATMTFTRPRAFMNIDAKEGIWELSRFATKQQYRVIGITSKLLEHFKRNYKWHEIYTFADLRFSTKGKNVYTILGFDENIRATLNYFYLVGGKLKYRWQYRKDIIKRNCPDSYDPDLSEYQNMLKLGHDRVWNAGIIKYVMKKG